MHFDGPHFEPDLIGPDGKLTRLHKGGRHKANQLQAKAIAAQEKNSRIDKRQAKVAKKVATRTAQADRQAATASAEAIAQAQREATAALESSQSATAPTQVIEDEESLMRARVRRGGMGSGFGVSSARALSQFGLGGNPAYLGQ